MRSLIRRNTRFNLIPFLLLLSIVFVFEVNNAYSQPLKSKNKKALKYYKQAVEQYNNFNYHDAIILLQKSLKNDQDFIEAWLLLGDSFTEVDSLSVAISAYKSAVNIDSLFYPGIYYLLGNLNYKLGKYSDAVDDYVRLSKMQDVSNELLLRTYERLIFASTSARLIEHPVPVDIKNIGSPINTSSDEYINYVNSHNDYLMFTQRTKVTGFQANKKQFKEELMTSDKEDSIWQKPVPIVLPWKNQLDMGSISISTNGNRMYFTGCYWAIGQGGCDLYTSKKTGDNWLVPNNLGNKINTRSWESQPVISSDGKKLYFASKRKGGKGGSDIWMSIKLKNNSWSPPINLGDSINTPKDEMSPFLHADGRTLFFSSTGHPGLGGYDLFISRQDELGRWSLAKNIGYPTNTKYNEINIFVNIEGDTSWISSDRVGGKGGMDIYTFGNYPQIQPQKTMYVEGTVVDKLTKKPLNAEIQITNLGTARIINTTYSDPVSGHFLLVVFPEINYAFNVSKKGYIFLSENINTNDSANLKTIHKEFELLPFVKGSQLVMNNIYFDFNKSDLLASSYIELNKLVELLNQNPNTNIEIVGHTDNIGDVEYNKSLSLKRAQSVGKYLIDNGISTQRLKYKGLGSVKPLATNSTEKGRSLNRRTEIVVE